MRWCTDVKSPLNFCFSCCDRLRAEPSDFGQAAAVTGRRRFMHEYRSDCYAWLVLRMFVAYDWAPWDLIFGTLSGVVFNRGLWMARA